MQKFRSSMSLKAAKLSESFRRKKKQQDDSNDIDNANETIDEQRDKENSISNSNKSPENEVGRPSSTVRTPPFSADRESKRRKLSPGQIQAADEAKKPLASKFGRHVVTEVQKYLTELHLIVRSYDETEEDLFGNPKCVLRGSWLNTRVEIGDVVHILADYSDDLDAFKVDDKEGLLVVNPDRLISGTSIVSSLFCMRKAVLSEWFKGAEGTTKTMFVGTLVHELLQEGLKARAASKEQLESILSDILAKVNILQDLLTLGMSEADIRQEVEPFLPHILYFTDKYVILRVFDRFVVLINVVLVKVRSRQVGYRSSAGSLRQRIIVFLENVLFQLGIESSALLARPDRGGERHRGEHLVAQIGSQGQGRSHRQGQTAQSRQAGTQVQGHAAGVEDRKGVRVGRAPRTGHPVQHDDVGEAARPWRRAATLPEELLLAGGAGGRQRDARPGAAEERVGVALERKSRAERRRIELLLTAESA